MRACHQHALLLILVSAKLGGLQAGEVHEALRKGETQRAVELVTKAPELLKSVDDYQCTPLHIAASLDQVDAVRALLALKANVNAKAYNGFLPLNVTTNGEIALLLIKHGTDLNHVDNWGKTPLQMAVENTNAYGAVASAIIDSGFPIDLSSALWLGKRDLAKRLIRENPSAVRSQEATADLHSNTTPLGIAALNGDREIVELLLATGAPVNTPTWRPDAGSISAIQNAVMARHVAIVELLCKAGADCNMIGGKFRDGRYDSLLEYAEKHSSPEIVAVLVRYGAKHGRGWLEQPTQEPKRLLGLNWLTVLLAGGIFLFGAIWVTRLRIRHRSG